MQVTAHMALVPLSRWHSILWWREWATSCWLPCLKPLNLFSSYTIKVFGLKVLICYMNIFSFNFKSMEFIFTLNFIYGTLSRGPKFHWLKIFLDIEFWIFQIKSIIYPLFTCSLQHEKKLFLSWKWNFKVRVTTLGSILSSSRLLVKENMMLCAIWYHSIQFKKREKHHAKVLLLVKFY